MVWSSMLFVVFVSVVCGGGLFSAELRSFLESHDLARSHCGVSFDVVTGQHSSAALFLNASFRLDPFVAQSEVRAVEVPTLQALFREMALEQRVADFQPGMFVKSFLPHFAPEHEREASQVTFFARRTQAVLGIALDPASLSRLSPDLRIALERLPERFDPSETEVWRGFFSRFCTHWVDEAVVGGRLQVSGRLFDASVSPKEVRDALEEHLLLVSSSDGARERLAALSGKFVSRLNAEGGAELNIVSVDALSKAAFEHWSQKIEQHPAVVRYSLRHISELAGAPAKQKAVRDAADHFLAAKHAEWRKDHMERFHGASLEEEHREHLKGKVNEMSGMRDELRKNIQLLEEQLEQGRECDARLARAKEGRENCVVERRAYQKSVVECETHSSALEDAILQRQACELALLSCRVPRRERKKEPEVPQVEADTEAPKAEEEPKREPIEVPHVEQFVKPTKDPLYDESTTQTRFLGMAFVVVLAAGLIILMLKTK